VNRVRDAKEENRVREVAESFELANVTCVPEDPNVLDFNSSGRPLLDLPDDSRSLAALQALTVNLNSPVTTAVTENS
jgi:CO dehydrogenase nickel-insertion accessory protein CooC1